MEDKEKKILAIGLDNEYEGHGTLWIDLSQPEILASYLIHNIDVDEEKTFVLKWFTEKEFSQLEE